MNKKILITGTSGYVGSHLAKSLEQSNYEIQRLNVRNSLWKNQLFNNIDVIIHTAALVHNNEPNAKLENYFKVNTHLPIELAIKAKNEGVKQFIFMSTMAVYGEDGELGIDDDITQSSKIKPVTDYGISKAKAEEKLLEMNSPNFKVVILRPPMIYGKDSPGNFSKLKKVAEILPVIPKINNSRSALYIKHLEEYIKQIIANGSNGIYHPKDSFDFNTTQVIKEIREFQDKKTILLPIPVCTYPLFNRIKFVSKLYGNLVYGKELYLNENKIQIKEQNLKSIIADIMNEK
ncbi:NAD-dependent epimerase/dehydratase family protein [Staphylococcus hominis]|uniref:NAD-dependent epimerase/dehydratase family protein n=1 Tax=Staphylococcus hominis TaxID=1290 RepID=UPI0034D3B2FB